MGAVVDLGVAVVVVRGGGLGADGVGGAVSQPGRAVLEEAALVDQDGGREEGEDDEDGDHDGGEVDVDTEGGALGEAVVAVQRLLLGLEVIPVGDVRLGNCLLHVGGGKGAEGAQVVVVAGDVREWRP